MTDGDLDLKDLSNVQKPYLILLDETQVSQYWDEDIWAKYIRVIAQGINHDKITPGEEEAPVSITLYCSRPMGSSMIATTNNNNSDLHQPFLTATQPVSLVPQSSLCWKTGMLLTKQEPPASCKQKPHHIEDRVI